MFIFICTKNSVCSLSVMKNPMKRFVMMYVHCVHWYRWTQLSLFISSQELHDSSPSASGGCHWNYLHNSAGVCNIVLSYDYCVCYCWTAYFSIGIVRENGSARKWKFRHRIPLVAVPSTADVRRHFYKFRFTGSLLKISILLIEW
jgi:hypothetical protein